MYARDLMNWLHRRLSDGGALEQSEKRFESLRAYGLLPKGRENAGVRLSSEQIASAVLGYGHPAPGHAGHASLILGKLGPVGGVGASFQEASSLLNAVRTLVDAEKLSGGVLSINLRLERDFRGEDYVATIYFQGDGGSRVASFVSNMATSLFVSGAERAYEPERLRSLSAVQRSLGAEFFSDLSREVGASRLLNMPLKTDWREYESEEEKSQFYRRLGAQRGSSFLNLRVDAQVTWPKEPTVVNFGGHQFVLFPKTEDNSHSISIDLARSNITAEYARSLISRLLSVMSWCDDRPASVHWGWSGNPVPVPVPRRDEAFMTTYSWMFQRSFPQNENLLRCLAYYRDGLNARSVGLASHAVLSFFRVFETKYHDKAKSVGWVNSVYEKVKSGLSGDFVQIFEGDVASGCGDVGVYIYVNCRVATAHAAKDAPSDPDRAEESRRLLTAAEVMQALARLFINQEFQFSSSYFSDAPT